MKGLCVPYRRRLRKTGHLWVGRIARHLLQEPDVNPGHEGFLEGGPTYPSLWASARAAQPLKLRVSVVWLSPTSSSPGHERAHATGPFPGCTGDLI